LARGTAPHTSRLQVARHPVTPTNGLK